MQAGRLFTVIGLLVAMTGISPATAQTVDDAAKFFDEVAANGTTQIIPMESGRSYNPNLVFTPGRSATGSCSSRVSSTRQLITIDWSGVIEASAPNSAWITIIGGVKLEAGDGSMMGLPGVFVPTNSAAMDVRLLKAIGIIVKSCAKPSHGF